MLPDQLNQTAEPSIHMGAIDNNFCFGNRKILMNSQLHFSPPPFLSKTIVSSRRRQNNTPAGKMPYAGVKYLFYSLFSNTIALRY
jgi:hypothetical protein